MKKQNPVFLKRNLETICCYAYNFNEWKWLDNHNYETHIWLTPDIQMENE